MKELLSIKKLTKTVFFLSICFSALFACTESGNVKELKNVEKVETNDELKSNVSNQNQEFKLKAIEKWNNDSKYYPESFYRDLLNTKDLYFDIHKKDFEGVDQYFKVNVYVGLDESDLLSFYVIDASKDNLDNKNILNDLVLCQPKSITQKILDVKLDSNYTIDSISVPRAWERVGRWNNDAFRDQWIKSKYGNENTTCHTIPINPLFSAFTINKIDFMDNMNTHSSVLALTSDSIVDLIIIDFDETNSVLTYELNDLVKTIPPCKPIIENYGVFMLIKQNTISE